MSVKGARRAKLGDSEREMAREMAMGKGSATGKAFGWATELA
jgi:hypothetical protein